MNNYNKNVVKSSSVVLAQPIFLFAILHFKVDVQQHQIAQIQIDHQDGHRQLSVRHLLIGLLD